MTWLDTVAIQHLVATMGGRRRPHGEVEHFDRT